MIDPARRRILLLIVITVVVLMTGILRLFVYLHSPTRGLPYHDSFVSGKADEWKALGGTWDVVDGAMRNDSDERGAKLLTGSTYWRNYSIEADVMLLGRDGDAGLMVRSSNEEEGVDSYAGYYAGLRNRDDSLVLGRADHGWMEDNREQDPISGGIQPFHWYHLKLLAYDCQIVVVASAPGHSSLTSTAIKDNDCVASGRVGLRSYSSGGVWKNVTVRPATHEDLVAMLGAIPSRETSTVQPSSAEIPEILGFHLEGREGPALRSNSHTQPIGSLRLSSFSKGITATVRGVVILTSPALFVQDSSGGVSVPHPKAPPLKVGDEVEVSGEVRPNDFSSTLEHASVRVLWARTPMPAVSVTASQAATGAFDANFIELEGLLRGKHYGPDNTLIFDFDAGPQSFRAIMNRGRGDLLFNKLKLNSLLRMRGICVVDPAYTQNLTPFVLLLRSTDDLKVLAGPPWWNAGHLVAVVIALLVFALVINFLYSRAENWRLRAVLEERERLAHEMHDTLAQSFAGIGFQLEAIRNGVPDDLPATHQQLDLASNLVHHSHEEARRSIATLRPQTLQSGDLLSALESCARRMVEGGSVRVLTNCVGDTRPIPLRITDTLYRVGQEAVANAVRHAHPTAITISLEYQKNMVRLLVADDGVGFTRAGDLYGFGLRGMQKRAATISATLQIMSAPGQGTRVGIVTTLPPRITVFSWPQFLWKYLMEHRPNVHPTRHQHPNTYRG
jgi:signal transduction histidine kinase